MDREASWVPETRFGVWFQSTRVWTQYVLGQAVDELDRLLAVRPRDFEHVLDAGCGAGLAFDLLVERFGARSVTAVDIDPEPVEQARESASGRRERFEVVQGSVEKLDIADGEIDLIFCHQTLHHVNEQQAALLEFHRVLKPGGILLLSESCRRFIHSLPVWALFRHPKGVQKSADEYLELLRSCGFDVAPQDVTGTCPFWSRPDFGLLERLGRPPPERSEPTQLNVVANRGTLR